MREYVLADVEKIWSKLGSENALRTHILSTIATGFANTRVELDRFMGTTFYACQQAQLMLDAIINKVLGFLETEGMISTAGGLHATKLGALVSRLYIDPLSASMMLHGLDDMHKAQVTPLTLLDLICKTPDIRRIYLRSDDYDWIGEIVAHYSDEFVHIPRESDREYERFLSEVKTALLIREWVEESHEDDITKRFGVGPGDIRALADTAQWLMHSLAELSAFKRTEYTHDSRELGMRIEYGARAELLDLIKLRGIGRVRARNLYNAGYHDTEALRHADFDRVATIVGTKTAKKALAQLGIHVD
ncbi:MAG TPA: hypothetical protein HA257_02520 [Candidatus Methanoperedenaceae archaeon]|nr:hypothetical protein [Candidatus Methanoperedenaceae archaeon]